MSNPTATPDAVVEAYVATWNETDPARRGAGIAAAWTETGIYRDPVMASDGHAGIDAMLAGVQAKFPGFVLKRTSKIDAHGGSLGGASGGSSGTQRGTSPRTQVRCTSLMYFCLSNGVPRWSVQRLSHSRMSPACHLWRYTNFSWVVKSSSSRIKSLPAGLGIPTMPLGVVLESPQIAFRPSAGWCRMRG